MLVQAGGFVRRCTRSIRGYVRRHDAGTERSRSRMSLFSAANGQIQRIPAVVLMAGLATQAFLSHTAALAQAPGRFESEIRAFEEADKVSPPPPGAIVFYGSSSIRLWKDLATDMAPLVVIQRGFGGSYMEEAVLYAPRILLPYKPSAVVLYEGDNDTAAGKSPDEVLLQFRRLVDLVHGALPETRVCFIAIKPSVARQKIMPVSKRANELIAQYCRTDQRLHFIDVWTPMLDVDGMPKPGLFVADNLHLNEAGYRLWTGVIRKALGAPESADAGKSGP
jgi:lysophospholipase L1-like esterase